LFVGANIVNSVLYGVPYDVGKSADVFTADEVHDYEDNN
jgi:hypothetical protein